MIDRSHRLATVVVSSAIVGLLLTPLVYVGIGALGHFAEGFALISLPLLLASCGFLFYRYLRRPGNRNTPRRWLVVEAVAWLLVAFFLVIVSGFTLLTTAERIGLLCTLVLGAAVVAAPWIVLRPTALATRVAQWPAGAVVACAAVASALLIGSTVLYQITPARFL